MFVKVKTATRFTQKSVPPPSLSFILFHYCLVNRLCFSPFVFNKTKNKGKKKPTKASKKAPQIKLLASKPKFNLWDPRGGTREPVPANCPLMAY